MIQSEIPDQTQLNFLMFFCWQLLEIFKQRLEEARPGCVLPLQVQER